MVDMHSHILYNVDDGANSIETAMLMLQEAALEGITNIIATPHSFHPLHDVPASVVFKQVACLNDQLVQQHIKLTVHTGQEVRLVEDLPEKIDSNEALTLANSKYLLLELPSSTVPQYTKSIVLALQSKGIIPIIAHPERNKAIAERLSKLEELIRAGAMAQITAGSLAGLFGKSIQKLSLELVRANLIHTYGSDAHNLTTRPFLFDAGLTYLEKHNLYASVDILLENNTCILENKDFILFEPQPVQMHKWWQIF